MYAPPPAPRSHKGLVIAIVLVSLLLLGAGAAFFLYSKSSHAVNSTAKYTVPLNTADVPACAGVLLYSGKTVGSGSQFCAKPGTGPADLPFVPQSFLNPQGSLYKWAMEGTTDSNNSTGKMNVSASAPGSISNLPATFIKVTSFSVTS